MCVSRCRLSSVSVSRFHVDLTQCREIEFGRISLLTQRSFNQHLTCYTHLVLNQARAVGQRLASDTHTRTQTATHTQTATATATGTWPSVQPICLSILYPNLLLWSCHAWLFGSSDHFSRRRCSIFLTLLLLRREMGVRI